MERIMLQDQNLPKKPVAAKKEIDKKAMKSTKGGLNVQALPPQILGVLSDDKHK
jgi:hypothetical protein